MFWELFHCDSTIHKFECIQGTFLIMISLTTKATAIMIVSILVPWCSEQQVFWFLSEWSTSCVNTVSVRKMSCQVGVSDAPVTLNPCQSHAVVCGKVQFTEKSRVDSRKIAVLCYLYHPVNDLIIPDMIWHTCRRIGDINRYQITQGDPDNYFWTFQKARFSHMHFVALYVTCPFFCFIQTCSVCHRRQVNIGSGNGLVLTENSSLLGPRFVTLYAV